MAEASWDILMCSIVHRTEMLSALLAELERQKVPGLGVRVFRDNLETGYGDKCQRLLESSSADYVSFLDDDDWIEPDFVATIMKALESKPDYVGFRVHYTANGQEMIPVIHSLEVDGWVDTPEALYRDIVHFNPIRRELATLSYWEGGDGADRRWARRLRDLGCVKTEAFIDREIHHYRFRNEDTFTAPRRPLVEHPSQPGFDFVDWVE